MRDLKRVDARGLSCPQPVIMTKRYMDEDKDSDFEVWVDNGAAKENVTRLAIKNGYKVEYEEHEDFLALKLSK